jgi:hypothetical protein
VATVTRTATRTKTREQKIRNEHRRPPPGFIPGGGLRRAGTTSVRPAQFTITDTRRPPTQRPTYPVAQRPTRPVAQRPTRPVAAALVVAVPPYAPQSHWTLPPTFHVSGASEADKTPFLAHQVREMWPPPPARRRTAGVRSPG